MEVLEDSSMATKGAIASTPSPPLTQKSYKCEGGGGGNINLDLMRRGDGTPWHGAAITPSTQRQNAKLSALLAFIGRMNGENSGREEGPQELSDIIQSANRFDHNQGASFERNFVEIQKLLERAKNADSAVDINALLNASESEKEKRKKKPANTAAGGSLGNGGGVSGGQQSVSSSSNNASQKPGYLFELSMLDGKSQAGRKPLRVIAAELDKRIEQLRSNQSEWDSFQLMLGQFIPDNRINQLNISKKLEVVKRKESQMEKGKQKEREELNKYAVNQKKWIAYMERTLNEYHFRKQAQIEENIAVRTIQRCWRNYKARIFEEKKIMAFGKIAKVFHIYVHRRRQMLKNKAADKIRQFFKEVHDVSKLLKIVKKYRFSVVKAQMLTRHFLEIRRAQVTLLCRYWDKHENGWWVQRKHGNADKFGSINSLEEKAKPTKSKKKGKKQQKEDDKDKSSEKTYIKIADSTKIRIVLEDLIHRKKIYRSQLTEYKDQYAKWSTEQKKAQQLRGLRPGLRAKTPGEDDKQAPKKPVFKVLPPVQDMYTLIERGFLHA
ncbi:hypothetical protein BC829DRAFT_400771 [Chytridium lagenaria]|nr:hypothetical protein BC829DRAFT_400771 [Chytridium lagenaria]